MSDTKRPLEVTPKGLAKFIHVNKPQTEYKDAGEYQVIQVLYGKEAASLKGKIDAAIAISVAQAKANKANAKHLKTIKTIYKPYKPDTDKEGNETGGTAFKFTAAASGKRKDGSIWTFKPIVFDAKMEKVDTKEVEIWGGSEVRVCYEIQAYPGDRNYSPTSGASVSLKLASVQVIKLKTGHGKTAKDFGFEAEESDEETPADSLEEAGNDGSGEENAEF